MGRSAVRHLSRALLVTALAGLLMWIGGFVATCGVYIPILGGRIFGLGSDSGSLIFVMRTAAQGERGAIVLRVGNIQQGASVGRMDFTRGWDDASFGPSIRSRQYVTRCHLGGIVAQTGRDVFYSPDLYGNYAVHYKPIDAWVVVLPWWFVLIGVGGIMGPYLRSRWVARSRRRLGLCLACGYDLRASGARCPECGEPRAAQEPPRELKAPGTH